MGTRTDLSRQCEDTQHDIEATRRRIQQKADALKGRLSAKELARPWIDPIRERLGGGGEKILEAFQENPLPLGLVGIGLGWLMIRDARPSRGGMERDEMAQDECDEPEALSTLGGESESESSFAESAKEKVRGVKESFGQSADAVQEKARDVKESLKHSAERVTGAARKLRESGRSGAGALENWFRSTLETNPWILALGAASVGAALGLGVPLTPWEEEHAGKLGERLAGAAMEKGKEAIEKSTPAEGRTAEPQVPAPTSAPPQLSTEEDAGDIPTA
ncbi:MAG: hypothetical protein JO332_07900 [Planctomycetaceae bacterium]|nr:hypothetical protein [Planctomycetaceae bacterium]